MSNDLAKLIRDSKQRLAGLIKAWKSSGPDNLIADHYPYRRQWAPEIECSPPRTVLNEYGAGPRIDGWEQDYDGGGWEYRPLGTIRGKKGIKSLALVLDTLKREGCTSPSPPNGAHTNINLPSSLVVNRWESDPWWDDYLTYKWVAATMLAYQPVFRRAPGARSARNTWSANLNLGINTLYPGKHAWVHMNGWSLSHLRLEFRLWRGTLELDQWLAQAALGNWVVNELLAIKEQV